MQDDLTLPDGSVRIPLRAKDGTVRAYAIVDAADAAWANQWTWRHLVPTGQHCTTYAIRSSRGRTVYMHRDILGLPAWVRGGPEGDHRNRDGLDNRRSNLRVLPFGGNTRNRDSHRGASSRFRGVGWHKRRHKWVAYISISGRVRYLGIFTDEREAAETARLARLKALPYTVEDTTFSGL